MKKIAIIFVLLATILVAADFVKLTPLGRSQTTFDTASTWKSITNVPIELESDSCVYFIEMGGGVTVDSVILQEYSPGGIWVSSDTLFTGGITTSFVADTTVSGEDTTIVRIYADTVLVSSVKPRTMTNVGYRQNIRYKASMDELGSKPYVKFLRTDLGK